MKIFLALALSVAYVIILTKTTSWNDAGQVGLLVAYGVLFVIIMEKIND